MDNQLQKFECHNLRLQLGDKVIFDNFNFEFSGPGLIKIEGDNGLGKTSLLKVFAGLIQAQAGEIKYSGLEIKAFGPKDYSYFATTSLGLLADLTGKEHIALIARALKLNSTEVLARIEEFEELELFKEVQEKKVSDFSQGMKQLLRLFLHLFFEPKILFLDEPFLYLSPRLKNFIQLKLEHLAQKSLVIVTDQKFTWIPSANQAFILLERK